MYCKLLHFETKATKAKCALNGRSTHVTYIHMIKAAKIVSEDYMLYVLLA